MSRAPHKADTVAEEGGGGSDRFNGTHDTADPERRSGGARRGDSGLEMRWCLKRGMEDRIV